MPLIQKVFDLPVGESGLAGSIVLAIMALPTIITVTEDAMRNCPRAMRGGANLVHSVDSSAKAIDLTNMNVELNFPGDTRHKAYAEDAFKYLDRMGDQYDLIILDPPAFAKHKDALRNALRGYTKLNAKAFEKIKPGGILFTFSCSQVVDKMNFRNAVFTAAAQSGRSVRILHQLTQPGDHPVNIYHPEGEYLKGLVLYVE